MRVEFHPNTQTENTLLNVGDKVSYAVARMTLDYTKPHIPMSRGKATSGQLRRSTSAYGVRGSNGNYSIGTITSYAKYVYNMDNSTTNWTTPNTNSRWFHQTFKKYNEKFFKDAISRYGKG